MTSKLKCPICGGDIQYNDSYSTYDCKNNPSEHYASEEVWQALNESQQATLENAQTILEIHKDLEIARKALEDITKEHNAFADWVFKAVTMKGIAEKALEQIEHKG